MAEQVVVLVGTTKGLFTLTSPPGDRTAVTVDGPHFVGYEFPAVALDTRGERPRILAGSASPHWGPAVVWSDDLGGTWVDPDQAPIAFPADSGATMSRVWQLLPAGADQPGVVWAGAEPASLWRSDDGGETYSLVEGLWDHPHRPRWEPGQGGLCLHTIITHPDDHDWMMVGISAAGAYRTSDGGATWQASNTGIKTPFLPEDEPEFGQCVHKIARHPAQPDRLLLQHHWGVYRSDDRGETWRNVGESMPAAGAPDGDDLTPFGFPIVAHPTDPETFYVLPLGSEMQRFTVDGRCRVYRTRDAGGSWEALTQGLPQEHAYLTILRDAFCADTLSPAGLWFGTRTGEVFASADEGDTWSCVVRHLPPVLCVRVGVVER